MTFTEDRVAEITLCSKGERDPTWMREKRIWLFMQTDLMAHTLTHTYTVHAYGITYSSSPGSAHESFPAVVVVVVDSHIQRIVLASEETTVTQQVSHRPIKCQSRLWSQRGTRVNGSHHGDNPLLRPTGIQIATKSYAALQAMAPTNIKTVHQTSILHNESNLDRLGMLSPTHDQRSQQKTGKITEKLRSNQF